MRILILSIWLLALSAFAQLAPVTLAWNPVLGPITNYCLFWGTSTNWATAQKLSVGTACTATVQLPVGVEYFFTVTAQDSSGNVSPFSTSISTTLLIPPKDFVRVRNYTSYTNWLDVTPNKGDMLILVANCYGNITSMGALNESPIGDKWQLLHTVHSGSGSNAVTLIIVVALNVQGVATKITFPITSQMTVEMVEYSGVTAVDVSALTSGANLSVIVTTTNTDMFFGAWINKAALANTSTSLLPGNVAAQPIRVDTNFYDGVYEWSNGGQGFPAGSYTLKMTTSNPNGGWVVLGFR